MCATYWHGRRGKLHGVLQLGLAVPAAYMVDWWVPRTPLALMVGLSASWLIDKESSTIHPRGRSFHKTYELLLYHATSSKASIFQSCS